MSDPLYVGLISGTSMDGIDAVIVRVRDSDADGATRETIDVIATHSLQYDAALAAELAALCTPGPNEIDRMGAAGIGVAEAFAQASRELCDSAGISLDEITAIGSHGQTIRHRPQTGFTLQIGDPSRIAWLTGCTTVADFRPKDMAAGGEGAPFAPALHAAIMRHTDRDRLVVNIGGIANVTLLPADTRQPVTGYDTGPGNALMDRIARQRLGMAMDANGDTAASGSVVAPLLAAMQADPYFALPPPKSTGREYFNLEWLGQFDLPDSSPDLLATLAELTLAPIAEAAERLDDPQILVCGGGARNAHLMQRLAEMTGVEVTTTTVAGLDPDWVEAACFGWLAHRTLNGRAGNLPDVTGAAAPVILGGVYAPR